MIIKMTKANRNDFYIRNESFSVTGRILPTFENGKWSYTEETFNEAYEKMYEKEEVDDSYIVEKEKCVYLFYEDNICIGRIKLRSNWNGYALIENILMDRNSRKGGVGTLLLQQAINWATENQFCGLMLVTQDVNVSACRFYAKNGFVLA